jgi:hypothetical protein
MKTKILFTFLTLFASVGFAQSAKDGAIDKISCFKPTFVGSTRIVVDMQKLTFDLNQEDTTSTAGSVDLVFQGEKIAILDLYRGPNRLGTLIAIDSVDEAKGSRLTLGQQQISVLCRF